MIDFLTSLAIRSQSIASSMDNAMSVQSLPTEIPAEWTASHADEPATPKHVDEAPVAPPQQFVDLPAAFHPMRNARSPIGDIPTPAHSTPANGIATPLPDDLDTGLPRHQVKPLASARAVPAPHRQRIEPAPPASVGAADVAPTTAPVIAPSAKPVAVPAIEPAATPPLDVSRARTAADVAVPMSTRFASVDLRPERAGPIAPNDGGPTRHPAAGVLPGQPALPSISAADHSAGQPAVSRLAQRVADVALRNAMPQVVAREIDPLVVFSPVDSQPPHRLPSKVVEDQPVAPLSPSCSLNGSLPHPTKQPDTSGGVLVPSDSVRSRAPLAWGQPRAAPMPAFQVGQSTHDAEPVVQVSIGRVEIRAHASAAASRPMVEGGRRRSALGLEEFLNGAQSGRPA